jgi:hypothetical protein
MAQAPACNNTRFPKATLRGITSIGLDDLEQQIKKFWESVTGKQMLKKDLVDKYDPATKLKAVESFEDLTTNHLAYM